MNLLDAIELFVEDMRPRELAALVRQLSDEQLVELVTSSAEARAAFARAHLRRLEDQRPAVVNARALAAEHRKRLAAEAALDDLSHRLARDQKALLEARRARDEARQLADDRLAELEQLRARVGELERELVAAAAAPAPERTPTPKPRRAATRARSSPPPSLPVIEAIVEAKAPAAESAAPDTLESVAEPTRAELAAPPAADDPLELDLEPTRRPDALKPAVVARRLRRARKPPPPPKVSAPVVRLAVIPVDVARIVDGRQLFRCEPLQMTLRAGVCVARQECWRRLPLTAFDASRRGGTQQDCRACTERRRGGYQRRGRPADLDARQELRVMWRASSNVAKLGGIPCSSTAGFTCPTSCSLRGNGCYAEFGLGGSQWRKLSRGGTGISWSEFLLRVFGLPPGQLWRHNLAGDLPGAGDELDVDALRELVRANHGRRGFTFTHKPMASARARAAIADANHHGLTVNLSADSPAHADALAELGVGPVVTLLAADAPAPRTTPGGRRIVVCPSQRNHAVTCASCQLCAEPSRETVIGFLAHGQMKRRISLRVLNVT